MLIYNLLEFIHLLVRGEYLSHILLNYLVEKSHLQCKDVGFSSGTKKWTYIFLMLIFSSYGWLNGEFQFMYGESTKLSFFHCVWLRNMQL